MRIGLGVTALNERLQSGQVDGIGLYTQHLLDALSASTDCSLQTFAYKARGKALKIAAAQALPGVYPLNALCSSVLKVSFPQSVFVRHQIDLYHSADQYIPKLKNIPVIATLMDPVPLMRPDWCRSRLRRAKNYLFRSMVQTADYYITISEFVVDGLVSHFNIPEDRISVIPLAVDEAYFAPVSDAEKQRVLQKYNLKPGYFLFIGTIQPRKNLHRVIEAFKRLPKELTQQRSLVVAGGAGWKSDQVIAQLKGLQQQGQGCWLNYIPPEDKFALLQSAGALVFPSLYEGFGLPVLEAFASSLPVITSNTTALPEVAGDAAVLVNPESIAEISDAMLLLAGDEGLRGELINKGLVRAHAMSWQRTVAQTHALYKRILN